MFQQLKTEFTQQQAAISEWWMNNAIDKEHGGFYGAVNNHNQPIKNTSKGVIQHSRILWYFSEAAKHTGNTKERQMADYAFEYFFPVFYDNTHGGVIWEVDCQGKPSNTRKQIYAQAFAIYAFTAYYRLTHSSQALHASKAIFDNIERVAWDKLHQGYFEAFDQRWDAISDVRLSERDPNWPKSMNTHLHIMEAYTALFEILPEASVANALERLIELIITRFVTPGGHLNSFFDHHWIDKSNTISYGHDIECSWLLQRAAEVLGDFSLLECTRKIALKIAANTLRIAVDNLGGISEGYTVSSNIKHEDHVWWVQAEALVGFLNAYEISQDPSYWQAFVELWKFTRKFQIDSERGEWFWHATLDTPSSKENLKSGFWKGPYHNGRAMLEICERLDRCAAKPYSIDNLFKGNLTL
ncbi:mannobiose 2-epimerase [Alteromonadaceae bacterium 2753L.S.0a.02]|nr:mannobiose 2-epimerase [Alteromonadaceae bacterium 2753L.S.0a.02]